MMAELENTGNNLVNATCFRPCVVVSGKDPSPPLEELEMPSHLLSLILNVILTAYLRITYIIMLPFCQIGIIALSLGDDIP
jgi:hypothetical protein